MISYVFKWALRKIHLSFLTDLQRERDTHSEIYHWSIYPTDGRQSPYLDRQKLGLRRLALHLDSPYRWHEPKQFGHLVLLFPGTWAGLEAEPTGRDLVLIWNDAIAGRSFIGFVTTQVPLKTLKIEFYGFFSFGGGVKDCVVEFHFLPGE